jgi:hypothetical protein
MADPYDRCRLPAIHGAHAITDHQPFDRDLALLCGDARPFHEAGDEGLHSHRLIAAGATGELEIRSGTAGAIDGERSSLEGVAGERREEETTERPGACALEGQIDGVVRCTCAGDDDRGDRASEKTCSARRHLQSRCRHSRSTRCRQCFVNADRVTEESAALHSRMCNQ